MRAIAVHTDDVNETLMGAAVAHELRGTNGKRFLRKGGQVDAEVLARWSEVAPGMIHLITFDEQDVHEDVAGLRVAEAVAGAGLRLKGPVQSRLNVVATRKGLLRVDAAAVHAINDVEGVTVFTLLDRQPVLPGKVVAGVKATPIAVTADAVNQAEQIARAVEGGVLRVDAFEPQRVAVLATEGLSDRMRERFRETVERKLRWYGAELEQLHFVENVEGDIADMLRAFLASGVDVILAAGGNTIDPLDPLLLALSDVGAEMIHFGAPSHPGSMFWLAQAGDTPIVNLASCSMYSKATVADLVLPLVMTGKQVRRSDIVEIGYGGLLERDMAFRFPDYAADSSDEADEEEGET